MLIPLRKSWILVFLWICGCAREPVQAEPNNPLHLLAPEEYEFRLISPTFLELRLVTSKPEPDSQLKEWDFVTSAGRLKLPPPGEFEVKESGNSVEIVNLGFKRRVLYATFKKRDLRILNSLYLKLAHPVQSNVLITLQNPNGKWWDNNRRLEVTNDPQRWSPAIHVNQTGYPLSHPKKAFIGYYMGSLGELPLSESATNFFVQRVSSGEQVFQGTLKRRVDAGFLFPWYRQVFEADFTDLRIPGEYRIMVPGLGASYRFLIDDSVLGVFARTYALGLYHQRCGAANELPYTRFAHGACHMAPADIPTMDSRFEAANESLKKETEDAKENPRHSAPQLKNVEASLYPFRAKGRVDVSGGHHDAGDYSKYTINSASFIHHLLFAADAFPGAADLDNLGIPESGDGKSDLLQEVKWEVDFLARMQDEDGGFFFLVYPREREYEDDVLPDKGDPQVVFPKTTSATAAAVAALAQCASSPTFKKQFPESAGIYLEKAKRGWEFLLKAIAEHGKDGAYQKITHYGDGQMHDDELAWAACEMYLATQDEVIHAKVQEWLSPSDPKWRKWGWWRLFDSYGSAIRSYAFGARTGRVVPGKLRPLILEQCENEIVAAGEDQLRRSERSAYGTSFPEETKRASTAGWYFSGDAAYDLAVAMQMDYPERKDPRKRFLSAIIQNLSYEQGCNPVNVVYLTGLGWNRQREIVHQYAQNDDRVLPPSGIPLGNVQGGFGWLYTYKEELDQLSFPSDGEGAVPYPIYDRWGDAFNLSQEFVILNQARSLGYLAWLMAQSPLKNQPWKSAQGHIEADVDSKGHRVYRLASEGLDLRQAKVVWERAESEPWLGGPVLTLNKRTTGGWIEAEALLPDGRRIQARGGE